MTKWSYGCLDFSYLKMWIVNYPTTLQDEGGRVHTNQAHAIYEYYIKEQLASTSSSIITHN
jgi:hypothetical protein